MFDVVVIYKRRNFLSDGNWLCFVLDDKADIDIPCPVLLLLGECDKTGKVQIYNRTWAEKGYSLLMIKNAAHNTNIDNPVEVNSAID